MPKYTSIQPLLVSGQTTVALQQLQSQVPASWQQSVLLLRASLSQLEKEVMNGMISSEEAQRRRNQINASTLQLLDKLESGGTTPESLFQELKSNYWNQNIAQEMAKQEENNTNISGSNINISGSSDVVIGSGNTVTKKIFKALGRWQFWTLLVVLAIIVGFMFFGGREVMSQQDANYTSLGQIQAQLEALIAQKGEGFADQLPQLKEQLVTGMKALKKEDYPTAIKELKELANQAPLASVYKNLAYAYEQNGQIDEAYFMRTEALRVDPNAFFPQKAAEIKGKHVDLLAPENGGEIVVTSDPNMERLLDFYLSRISVNVGSWAVFGFNEGHLAIIDRVDFFIPASDDYNPRHFELLVSTASENGPFTSIGKFEPQNAFIKKKPFQEFSFEPVKAKYVKIIMGPQQTDFSYVGIYEMRLWGKLQ